MQLKCNVKHWDLKRRFKVVWRCITTTTTTIIIIIINYIELLFIIIVLLFFYFLGSLLQSRRHENLALTIFIVIIDCCRYYFVLKSAVVSLCVVSRILLSFGTTVNNLRVPYWNLHYETSWPWSWTILPSYLGYTRHVGHFYQLFSFQSHYCWATSTAWHKDRGTDRQTDGQTDV